MRFAAILTLLFASALQAAPETPAMSAVVKVQADGFEIWVTRFRDRALAQGITAATFDAAFADARYLTETIERDRNQAEFVKPLADYMATAVSDARITNGRAHLQDLEPLLTKIEDLYGVDRHIVVAIWGMESNYGQRRGDVPLIATLATLAYDGRRGKFFEQQLIAALKILQRGDVTPENMTGSWAGAMGHTQFIPTSYQAYAVDITEDGRRDIWADDPSDALASTAAYLARFGWRKGQPWGVEVQLPEGFDYGRSGRNVKRSPSAWGNLGVRDVDGDIVANHGDASLITPTGAQGPAFLVFSNYDVISRYNNAAAYIIGVGHLGDRINGAGPLATNWPEGERSLTRAERRELQRHLNTAGFPVGGVDGIIGPATRRAIRAYQRTKDLPEDGYASVSLLESLR